VSRSPNATTLRRSTLKLGVAGLFFACASCASHLDVPSSDLLDTPAQTSAAVVHGAPDHGRHPGVVALLVTDGGSSLLCSGALVAQSVVLTARHCVAHLRSESMSCPASSPQVGATRDPRSIAVVSGDDADASPLLARGAEIVTTPGSSLCEEDIALVRLDRAVTGIAPIPIGRRRTPLRDGRIVAVGYGQSARGVGAGLRRFRIDVPIVDVSAHEFVVGESTCSGDSGGPALDEDSGEILGVVSRGNVQCAGIDAHNVYTRVSPFLDAIDRLAPPTGSTPKPPATDMGDSCTVGVSCSSGVCVLENGKGYCSRQCGGADGRCPSGYRCGPSNAGTEVCRVH
jgi:hypothetical protein